MIKLIARIAGLDCNVILPLCQSLTWQPAGLALDKGTMLGEKQSVRSLLKKWKLELKLHAYSFQDICDLWDRVMMPWPIARQLHIQRFLENTFKERFCTIVTFETFDQTLPDKKDKDNWEPEFMTIIVSWQLRVDSVCNFLSMFFSFPRLIFCVKLGLIHILRNHG